MATVEMPPDNLPDNPRDYCDAVRKLIAERDNARQERDQAQYSRDRFRTEYTALKRLEQATRLYLSTDTASVAEVKADWDEMQDAITQIDDVRGFRQDHDSKAEREAMEEVEQAWRAIINHDLRSRFGGHLEPYEGEKVRSNLRAAAAALDAIRALATKEP